MTMAVRGRHAGLAVVALAIVTGASACAPTVCPAIGWSDTLVVRLRGDATAVARVQLCTDAGCAPAEGVDAAGPLGPIALRVHEDDVWTFTVDGLPDTFTVRALAADGSTLSAAEVTPEWVRVGGSARCGGPHKATVTLRS